MVNEMTSTLDFQELDPNFKYEVSREIGGQNIKLCFNCGICTVSCPVRKIDETFNPRRLIRMILYGMKKEVLSDESIWKCAHCLTCLERCPQDVKFAEVIEALRIMAVKEAEKGNIKIKGPQYKFDSIFKDSIKSHGRVFETGLLSKYMLKKKDLGFVMSFSSLGLKMLRKGKIGFFPDKIKGLDEIHDLFKESSE
ncbi:MAG: 4Fe-4S dicluster domain-containing protein [Candidatus Bathyarchaeota archaeon]|jgi:heterodisulfide reductase subunit C